MDSNNSRFMKDEFSEDYINNYNINPKFDEEVGFFDKFDILATDRKVTEILEVICIVTGFIFALILIILFLMTTRCIHIFCITTYNNPNKNLSILRDLLHCRDPVFTLVREMLRKEGTHLTYERYLHLLYEFDRKFGNIDKKKLEKVLSSFAPDDELVAVDLLEKEELALIESKRLRKPLDTVYVIAVKELDESDTHGELEESKAMLAAHKQEIHKKLIITGEADGFMSEEEALFEQLEREETERLLTEIETSSIELRPKDLLREGEKQITKVPYEKELEATQEPAVEVQRPFTPAEYIREEVIPPITEEALHRPQVGARFEQLRRKWEQISEAGEFPPTARLPVEKAIEREAFEKEQLEYKPKELIQKLTPAIVRQKELATQRLLREPRELVDQFGRHFIIPAEREPYDRSREAKYLHVCGHHLPHLHYEPHIHAPPEHIHTPCECLCDCHSQVHQFDHSHFY